MWGQSFVPILNVAQLIIRKLIQKSLKMRNSKSFDMLYSMFAPSQRPFQCRSILSDKLRERVLVRFSGNLFCVSEIE